MSVSRRAFTQGLGTLSLLQAKTALPHSHELATVEALAEVIIPATDTPGAREARVAEYLDLILSDSPELVRTTFLEGLWWTDGYSQRTSGASFKDLSAQEQLRLVSALHDSAEDSQKTGRQFVHSMNAWTAKVYYSTETGEQELNKDGRVPATYSGHCES